MIEKFTSQPLEKILFDLYALKVRERDGEKIEQPLITLLLGGSRTPVRGFLIDLRNDLKEKGVVLKLQDSNDVLFLEMYAVAGIAIHEADRVMPLLVELKSEDVAKLPSISRLDVKRQQADEVTALSKQFGGISITFNEELPADAVELYFTRWFLSDVSMALTTIAKTETGKEAIKEQIKAIQIKRDTHWQISRNGDSLVVHYPFNKSFTTNLARQELIDKLYDVL